MTTLFLCNLFVPSRIRLLYSVSNETGGWWRTVQKKDPVTTTKTNKVFIYSRYLTVSKLDIFALISSILWSNSLAKWRLIILEDVKLCFYCCIVANVHGAHDLRRHVGFVQHAQCQGMTAAMGGGGFKMNAASTTVGVVSTRTMALGSQHRTHGLRAGISPGSILGHAQTFGYCVGQTTLPMNERNIVGIKRRGSSFLSWQTRFFIFVIFVVVRTVIITTAQFVAFIIIIVVVSVTGGGVVVVAALPPQTDHGNTASSWHWWSMVHWDTCFDKSTSTNI